MKPEEAREAETPTGEAPPPGPISLHLTPAQAAQLIHACPTRSPPPSITSAQGAQKL